MPFSFFSFHCFCSILCHPCNLLKNRKERKARKNKITSEAHLNFKDDTCGTVKNISTKQI